MAGDRDQEDNSFYLGVKRSFITQRTVSVDSEVRTTVSGISLDQSHYYHLLFLSLPFFLSHNHICLFSGVWFQHSTQAKQDCGALITITLHYC